MSVPIVEENKPAGTISFIKMPDMHRKKTFLKIFHKKRYILNTKLKNKVNEFLRIIKKMRFVASTKTTNNTQLQINKIGNDKLVLLKSQIIYGKDQFPCKFEIDTGSGVNLISSQFLQNNNIIDINRDQDINLVDYNGKKIDVMGSIKLYLNISNYGKIKVPFYVVHSDFNILGRQFMTKTNFNLSFHKNKYFFAFTKVNKIEQSKEKIILLNKTKIELLGLNKTFIAFQTPLELKNGQTLQVYNLPSTKLNVIPQIVTVDEGKVYIEVINSEQSPLVFAAGQMRLGSTVLKNEFLEDASSIKNHFGTKYAANDFQKFRTNSNMNATEVEIFGEFYESVHNISLIRVIKKILNKPTEFTEKPIQGGSVFHEMEPTIGAISNDYFEVDIGLGAPILSKSWDKVELEKVFEHHPKEVKEFLVKTFLRYPILSTNPWDCGQATEPLDIEIDPLKKHLLENQKIYPLKHEMKEQLLQFLHYLLFNRIIERAPPNKTYGSPVFLIKRKSGQQSVRLLVDNRKANQAILGTSCAVMSCITRALKAISEQAVWVTQLDLRQAFYSLPYSRKTIETGLTQFITEFGAFRFIRAVTGNSRSPGGLIDYLIKHLHMDDEMNLSIIALLLCHFDDINIFNMEDSLQEHLDKVLLVVSRLHRMGLKLNLEKCKFAINLKKEQIKILGYMMGKNNLSPPMEKMQALNNIQRPKTVKDCQKFLGGLTYFRQMLGLTVIDNMNILSSKIRNNILNWDDQAEVAFESIKREATSGKNCISTPTMESINILFSDSSSNSIGGILFSAPLDALNLGQETYKIKYNKFSNKNLSHHVEKYKLDLQEIDKADSIMEIFIKANILFDLKLEKTGKNLRHQLLTHGQLFGPQYSSKLVLNGETKIQAFDKLLYNIANNKQNILNEVDFLLMTFSSMIDRQIFILIEGVSDMKTEYIKVGNYSLKTPIFLGHSTVTGKFYLFGKLKCSGSMKCSNYKYSENLNYDTIVRTFFKLLKSKNVVLEHFKIGGYFSRTLTHSERTAPIYVSEGRAIFETLQYFEEQISGRPTIILTDSEICQALFSFKNLDANRRLHKLALKLIHSFEYVRVLSVPGRVQLSDFLTRLDIAHPLADKMYLRNTKNDVNTHIENGFESKMEGYSNFAAVAQTVLHKENKTLPTSKVKIIKQEDKNTLFNKYLSLSKILEAQLQNLENYDNVLKNKRPAYKLDNEGVIRNTKSNKILFPDSLIFILIAFCHQKFNHAGRDALKQELTARFDFEKGLKLDEKIVEYLNSCLGCLVGKSTANRNIIGSAVTDKLESRGDLITIDLLEAGTNSTSNLPSAYLFVLDVLTKHLSVYFLKKKQEKDVIFALLSYISSYGEIKRLLSDNASIFRSKKFKNFCTNWGIELVQTAPGYSQGRAHVERMIGLARQHIRVDSANLSHTSVLTSIPLFVIGKNSRKINGTEVSPNDLQAMSLLSKSSPYFCQDEMIMKNKFGYKNNLNELIEFRKNNNNCLQNWLNKLKTMKKQELLIKNKFRKLHKLQINDFVLIKLFHSSTASEKQNLAKFSSIPHQVIYVGKHFVSARNILTDVIVKRNISHVKKLELPIADSFTIPADLLSKLQLISTEEFDPKLAGRLNEIPQAGKRLTRAMTRQLDLDTSPEVDFDTDLTYF